jgi:rare lipoprotein A
LFTINAVFAQGDEEVKVENKASKNANKILYGLASFYAQKFHGRETANGEIFSHAKFTAACNVLPLGTWVQVTNLRNGKIIVVRTNDRLHPKTRRIIDLTYAAAQKLGFVKNGLTRVKIEILDQKKYNKPGKK